VFSEKQEYYSRIHKICRNISGFSLAHFICQFITVVQLV